MTFFTSEFPTFNYGRLFDHPFFDDTEKHVPRRGGRGNNLIRTCFPRFDFWEEGEGYVIQGEVPGVEMKDITIEWNKDALQISGRILHNFESGTPPSGLVESSDTENARKATESDREKNSDEVATKSVPQVSEKRRNRYFLSERIYGFFNRSFSFPTAVAHDKVTAKLLRGVLTIIIPMAPARKPIRVEITQGE